MRQPGNGVRWHTGDEVANPRCIVPMVELV